MEKQMRTNRHCRVCGCVPCLDGTLCEGDMYPMDHVIRVGMREAFPSFRLIRRVQQIVSHPRYQAQPRSPKPRR
jgi:hypothetical protein